MAIGFGKYVGVLDGGLTFTNVAIITASFYGRFSISYVAAERINDHGIGNGISTHTLINIVADMPNSINSLVTKFVTGASSIAYSIVAAV